MKTTVEISDALLSEAKAAAKQKGTTLRELIERGLVHVLHEETDQVRQFRLSDASVKGQGLVRDYTWDEIRGMIYEDCGS